MSDADISHAPWTDEEVENLWLRQGALHPYTCNGFDGITHATVNLTPKTDGWHCPRCPFKQNWAHTQDVKRRLWWEQDGRRAEPRSRRYPDQRGQGAEARRARRSHGRP